MKRSLVFILVILCCFGAYALADECYELEIGKDVTLEIVPGGGEQTVRAQYVGVDEDRIVELVVFGSDGGVNLFDTQIVTLTTGRIEDINNDGIREILLSGEVFAMDDVTYCLSFTDEAGITAHPFADIDRGGDRTGYTDTGYGSLMSQPGESVSLIGYQDVLGTYRGYRTFDLVGDRMELNDDGLWHFVQDEEIWGYGALVLKKPLEVKMNNGRSSKLKPGEAFIVTASDLVSVVHFLTEDGREGSFAIEPDQERGWGSLINGISENEYFEYVPYAG